MIIKLATRIHVEKEHDIQFPFYFCQHFDHSTLFGCITHHKGKFKVIEFTMSDLNSKIEVETEELKDISNYSSYLTDPEYKCSEDWYLTNRADAIKLLKTTFHELGEVINSD